MIYASICSHYETFDEKFKMFAALRQEFFHNVKLHWIEFKAVPKIVSLEGIYAEPCFTLWNSTALFYDYGCF